MPLLPAFIGSTIGPQQPDLPRIHRRGIIFIEAQDPGGGDGLEGLGKNPRLFDPHAAGALLVVADSGFDEPPASALGELGEGDAEKGALGADALTDGSG